MRGTRYRKASSKRWALTWALLLSVYVAIGLAPTAYAAATACATSNGAGTNDVLNVTLNGDDWVDFTAVSGDSGADVTVATQNPSGCGTDPYENILKIVITSGGGVSLSETVTLHNAGASAWDLLTGGIYVALSGGTTDEVYFEGGAGADDIDAGKLLTSVQGVEIVSLWGNAGDDVLTGVDGVENQFHGWAGADSMTGGNNDDVFFEGDGFDTVEDTIVGGGGSHDLVDYYAHPGTLSVRALPVVIDLDSSQSPAPISLAGSEDDFTDGTVEDVIGTSLDDEIVGNGLANEVHAGEGADTVDGAGGNDTLFEGSDDASVDTISGGDGLDTVDYSDRAAGVVADLDPVLGTMGDCSSSEDVFDGDVENAVGTANGDTLCGTSLANQLTGDAGSDTLWGVGGNDVLSGGDGADSIFGGSGDDVISGGSGDDPQLLGASGRDTIYGDAGNDDEIKGGAGNDRLIGGTGLDKLYGEGENDTLEGTKDGSIDLYDGGGQSAKGQDSCIIETGEAGGSGANCEKSRTVK